jgi:branched-subunit amino acid transport protein AzlD
MPDTAYLAAAVAVSAAVTWGLRALPFTVLGPMRASRTVGYLADHMPAGVMVILCAYCLRSLPVAHPVQLLGPLPALAVTIGLQLWRRSALLSILAGTVVYVVIASTVLARLT